jgi:hypothetical protein
MSYFAEKPKNDSFDLAYEKPKNEVRERGGCLTAFIGYIVIVNLAVVLLTFSIRSSLPSYADTGTFDLFLGLQVVMTGAALACAYGLWTWQKWGYYGLMALYGLNIALSILTGQFTSIGGSVLGIVLLYYVMRDKQHWLE